MLNRARVLEKIEERNCPQFLKQGEFAKNLGQYLAANGKAFPKNELEARICLIEEALVAWFEAKPEGFTRQFMDDFGFNWEDVRNLKGTDVSCESDIYRVALLGCYQAFDHENYEDVLTAMRLVEKWVKQNASENYDGGEPELIFATAMVIDFLPKNAVEPVAMSMVRRRASYKHIISLIFYSIVYVLLSLIFNNTLITVMYCVFIGINLFAILITMWRNLWFVPSRLKSLFSMVITMP